MHFLLEGAFPDRRRLSTVYVLILGECHWVDLSTLTYILTGGVVVTLVNERAIWHHSRTNVTYAIIARSKSGFPDDN